MADNILLTGQSLKDRDISQRHKQEIRSKTYFTTLKIAVLNYFHYTVSAAISCVDTISDSENTGCPTWAGGQFFSYAGCAQLCRTWTQSETQYHTWQFCHQCLFTSLSWKSPASISYPIITCKVGVTVQKVKITGKNISLSIAIITIKTMCLLISTTLKNNLRAPAVVRKETPGESIFS